jgi:hypothetical protein
MAEVLPHAGARSPTASDRSLSLGFRELAEHDPEQFPRSEDPALLEVGRTNHGSFNE